MLIDTQDKKSTICTVICILDNHYLQPEAIFSKRERKYPMKHRTIKSFIPKGWYVYSKITLIKYDPDGVEQTVIINRATNI